MESELPSISPPEGTIGSSQDADPVVSPALPAVFSRWTLLTNHAHVLVLLGRHPSIVLREVAAQIGITERAVQRIIHELEQDGYIVRQKVGRQNSYQINGAKGLRHPLVAHCPVKELLDLIARCEGSQR